MHLHRHKHTHKNSYILTSNWNAYLINPCSLLRNNSILCISRSRRSQWILSCILNRPTLNYAQSSCFCVVEEWRNSTLSQTKYKVNQFLYTFRNLIFFQSTCNVPNHISNTKQWSRRKCEQCVSHTCRKYKYSPFSFNITFVGVSLLRSLFFSKYGTMK